MAIERVAVLGGGQMGSGIAEAIATAGIEVTLIKATPGPADQARAGIAKNLDRQVDKGKIAREHAEQVIGRITFTDRLEAAAGADLLIESVIEDIEVKRRYFAEAAKFLGPQAIVASNTSTLRIGDMAPASGRPERFLGLHFFNPAQIMKLVEVVPSASTDAEVTAEAVSFVERIGKTPVLVKDSTGFIVNRLLTPYMVDAIRCLEAGLADVAGIDTAMHLGANHPMGPLALADYIGLDIVQAMARNLLESFGQDYMGPTPLLDRMVAAGMLGRKSGRGFYDYSGRPPRPNPDLPL
ncbi:MAG: 3-hydroxyacyl-CoA dehydrogenase family protein [Candidatus Dadabacteria bacterium]|nr:MAG: 3-hydroxyacyl-CoA dehydrogenase family protein [Candidatus Dadabacteria bacterium]